MEKLLHWSIASAQGDKDAVEKAGQPDPKLLQQLFGGGPDEPALMKQAVQVITNPEAELENKLVAFDNLQMLIENLDNANNLENLRLWEPLIGVLDSPEAELRANTLWVIGTAVQNNDKSQNNFMKYKDSMKKLVTLVNSPEEQASVKVKGIYALSNLVRHNKVAHDEFVSCGGMKFLSESLKNKSLDQKVKMRLIALLAAVTTSVDINEEFIDMLRKEEILSNVIHLLQPDANLYLIDRVLNFLTILFDAKVTLADQEGVQLRVLFDELGSVKDQLNEDDYLRVQQFLK
ncbi:HBL154Cp [Eremothecium sinecaudum]|uniref:Hsp70 nucleotide exchange factor FES1 n=1 Tax=Eremothecium sinecaudum TaxID=45286 RepID=A0A109UWB4_9SACH|nr:HBL154Cp [Eremothecium sinecaudum]AMD18748.1 HBL154Cp [Eremothecium sinecaudum]